MPENPALPMSQFVAELMARFTRLWWDCSVDFPTLDKHFSRREQLTKEQQIERGLNELMRDLKHQARNGTGQQADYVRITTTCEAFAKSALDLEERHLDLIRSYGFLEVAAEFARQARRFDTSLTDADLFQASRNVWSMNFMQVLLGLSVQLTPAILAYSLLYPYSDNYLDDPATPAETKRAFNRRFRQRLEGIPVKPANSQEARISDLIGIIENQFERRRYPQVFDSLLAIHQAQSQSLALLQPGASPYEIDVLGICFEKGGTSVLADGYLVAGDLTSSERELMFHYGTFTQLIDDLEDVQKDLDAGLQTIYSQSARHWPLDNITNRTFAYAQMFINRMDDFLGKVPPEFQDLLRRSIPALLTAQAGSARRYYSRSYLRDLEACSPVRFDFLDRQRKKILHQKISAMSLIEVFAAAGAPRPVPAVLLTE
jgi:hypothetical protein